MSSASVSTMSDRVFLLAPSCGLGGGIERYVETLESAFAGQGVEYRRFNLRGPGGAAHAGMFSQARGQLRADGVPTRLVVAHRALLPVASLLDREPAVTGISVICHGNEVWGRRPRARQRLENYLMKRSGVRLVAASAFTAGALCKVGTSTVLPPGLSPNWYRTLADASRLIRLPGPGLDVVTAFRLSQWRDKGLPELLDAVAALGRRDVHVTVCGSGKVPRELNELVGKRPSCSLRRGLSDQELASQLAAADLFVLATKTVPGRRTSGEGFGLVLLESQVAGTPVVAPASGGSRDAYLEGITGVSPAAEGSGPLASVLHGLLEDDSRRAQMAKQAAAWAQDAFDPERYAALAVSRLL
jgi:phosphatidyl-myo-inositol dimannoside synthase